MGRRRGFKPFGKRSRHQITLSRFPGVTSDFSYSTPGREFHDPMVRRDYCPEFVEHGSADDGVVRRGERHHNERHQSRLLSDGDWKDSCSGGRNRIPRAGSSGLSLLLGVPEGCP
ncbi:hypothetical protein B296_00015062 [Ensete ventricosum]|uniref:Uncharacterized protein n=1 Tax=Ensete ventricosum TaxID=4639 RepID=A0A426ZK08_ENSVE|nr:hypothetical protein B296_00015062 [Ensete ventricosum]